MAGHRFQTELQDGSVFNSRTDPAFAFPLEIALEIFANLDYRDLYAVSHVSHHWRRLANDEHMWAKKLALRWNGGQALADGKGKRTSRDIYYEKALFLSAAQEFSIECADNPMAFKTVATTASRFGKIIELESVHEFKISMVAKQVPPGRYQVYWRFKFAVDAGSNCGFVFRVIPLKVENHDEDCPPASDLLITPYCIFLYRTGQWLLTRSQPVIAISNSAGPRDIRLEICSAGRTLNNGISFDYAYIRDVTACYYNVDRGPERLFRDGPDPMRLDMLGAEDEGRFPRISSAF